MAICPCNILAIVPLGCLWFCVTTRGWCLRKPIPQCHKEPTQPRTDQKDVPNESLYSSYWEVYSDAKEAAAQISWKSRPLCSAQEDEIPIIPWLWQHESVHFGLIRGQLSFCRCLDNKPACGSRGCHMADPFSCIGFWFWNLHSSLQGFLDCRPNKWPWHVG